MDLSSLCLTLLISEHDDRTDRLASVHQIEALVDFLQLEDMGDHRIDLDLSVHVPVNDLRHIGAATRAAERRAFPHAAGHKLERTGRDFLSGFGDGDDDGNAPATMAAFQRLAHHGGIAGAVERVVGAAVGQPNEVLDDVAGDLLRIDEMGHAELAAPFLLAIVNVDADDLVSTNHLRTLDDVEPDAAEAKHYDIGARRDLGRVDDGADAGRHAATDVAALVERRILADLRHRDLRQHGEVGEGRAAHIVVDRLALVGEAAGSVGHHALALRRANRGAQVGLLAQAAFALAAFWRVERDHVIARFHRYHAGANLANDTCALMAEDRRKDSFAVKTVKRVGVGMTDPCRLYLDKDFTGFRSVQINLDDLERFLCFERDSSACLHSQLHFRFSSRRKNMLLFVPADHRLPMQEFSAWV